MHPYLIGNYRLILIPEIMTKRNNSRGLAMRILISKDKNIIRVTYDENVPNIYLSRNSNYWEPR